MESRDVGLAILMVFSAVMLTYKWLSLYDNVDAAVIFFAFLLTFSLGALLISIELRMQRIMEEFENTKRVIAANSYDLEERLEGKIAAYVEGLDERLDRMEKRMYR
ncbi:hypothetical protein DRO97_02705 [Archaeoglobales archaeon]|nr:MAG: hypothetical protein DRO97_02705 [Archaeoglobales archaeon]